VGTSFATRAEVEEDYHNLERETGNNLVTVTLLSSLITAALLSSHVTVALLSSLVTAAILSSLVPLLSLVTASLQNEDHDEAIRISSPHLYQHENDQHPWRKLRVTATATVQVSLYHQHMLRIEMRMLGTE